MQGFIIWFTTILIVMYIVAGIIYLYEKNEGFEK